jgi:methionine biosynthesis protein MetW
MAPDPDVKASTSDQLQRYYDVYFNDLWRPFERPNQPAPRRVAQLLRRHVFPGARCLDVGCGDGRTGRLVTDCGGSYVGVDISERAAAATRERGLDARDIQGSDALPFSDQSFDVVLCLEVIEHVLFPDRTVREILRVLRPGGVLIATTPNVAYWRRRLDLALLGRWNPFGYSLAVERPWGDPHIRFFNPGSLYRLLLGVGFAPVRVGGHSGSVLRDLPWIGRRLAPPDGASALYRQIEDAVPSLFGCFLNAVAVKPIPVKSS